VTEILLYRCYAKVNLSLEVLRRRDDGYHDLVSLVHTIGLADDLHIQPADKILTRVEGLETIENNLVTRAAHLLAASTHTRLGADLTLLKRIPSAAGLGGGSSDAATTLVGLNSLWGTQLHYHALVRLATQLGSDVPFFLRGGAALMRGRGDELYALPSLGSQWLVVAVPELALPNKTATLYGALQPEDFSSGEVTEELARHVEHGDTLDGAPLVNAFERAARTVFPGLSELWSELERTCARSFYLSGAGPALFALATNRAQAELLVSQVARPGVAAFAARTVHHARASVRLNESDPIEYP
jgi:4-diphosphocytidyl-2-C-methyl-D-erythritol kinase